MQSHAYNKKLLNDFLLIISVTALITFLSIITKSFWGDEVWSINASHNTLLKTLEVVSKDIHPPLYFLLLSGWTSIFGISEISLRVFQGVQGVIFLFSSLVLFRKVFPFSKYHPYWVLLILSSEFWLFMPMIRYYTLAASFATLATYCFIIWLENSKLTVSFILVLLYILVLYTDYPTSIIIAAHFLFILFFKRDLLLKHIKCLLVTALFFLPILFIVIRQIAFLHEWEQYADFNKTTFVIIVKVAYSLYAFFFGETLFPFTPFAILLISLLTYIIIIKTSWKSVLDKNKEAFSLFLISILSGLIFTSLITGYIARHHSFIYTPSRNLYALPLIFLLLGIISKNNSRAIFRKVLFMLLLFINLYGNYNWILNRHFFNPVYASPWKSIMSELEGEKGVIFVDESICYEYYVNQHPDKVYPTLVRFNSLEKLTDTNFKNAFLDGSKIYVLKQGRDSTLNLTETPDELIDFLENNKSQTSHKKYIPLDKNYKKIKEKILRRESYDAKFNLFTYE